MSLLGLIHGRSQILLLIANQSEPRQPWSGSSGRQSKHDLFPTTRSEVRQTADQLSARPPAASRSKKWNASAPAPGPRPCRSTTTSTTRSRPGSSTRSSMLYNEPSPLETKVLSRRFGLPNSQSIDTYLANDGYKAFEKAL